MDGNASPTTTTPRVDNVATHQSSKIIDKAIYNSLKNLMGNLKDIANRPAIRSSRHYKYLHSQNLEKMRSEMTATVSEKDKKLALKHMRLVESDYNILREELNDVASDKELTSQREANFLISMENLVEHLIIAYDFIYRSEKKGFIDAMINQASRSFENKIKYNTAITQDGEPVYFSRCRPS